MTNEDIEAVIEAFGKAAARVKSPGADAVQVHGAHGLRAQLAKGLVENPGFTMAETARQIGAMTSPISRILERRKRLQD